MTTQRLGVGIYEDDEGTMHVVAAEVCEFLGIEPTADNQDLIARLTRDLINQTEPACRITQTLDDGWTP